jgi:membrane protease YdiL (CAAX protease family)
MREYLLFLAYLFGFLGLAILLVPSLQPWLGPLGLEPATSLYRVPMLGALLLMPWFLRYLALNSWPAAGYSLPRAAAWAALGKGLLIGIGIMAVLTVAQWALGMHHLEADRERFEWLTIAKVLVSGLFSGLAVGFIEETFFRGLMHSGMRRTLSFGTTALLTALLYAVMHFIKPADLGNAPFDVENATRMVIDGLSRPGDFAPIADSFVTLVIVGLFLSLVRERTGNILWAIGIHAGWVMIIKLAKHLTDPTLTDGRASPWIGAGYDHITGWMASLWLGLIMAAYWFWTRPASRPS